MNLKELKVVQEWIHEELPEVLDGYNKLYQILNHNASQHNKQPLSEHFESQRESLHAMNYLSLNREQRRLVSAMGGNSYLGEAGAEFLEQIKSNENFDPATEAKRVNEAVQNLKQLSQRAINIQTAFDDVDIPDFYDSEGNPNETIVRVEFREGASIANVKELKYWSGQWYDIARGVAMATGSTPEDIRVISAGRGSILLDLGMLYGCARLFSAIVGCVTDAALKVTKLQLARDSLRREQLLTDAIDKDLAKQESELKERAVESILANLENKPGVEINGELTAVVSKSANRLLNFHQRGGLLDFTTPQAANDDSEEDDTDRELLENLQNEIRELRISQTELKALTQQLDHPDLDVED